jgi:hypothetical protein
LTGRSDGATIPPPTPAARFGVESVPVFLRFLVVLAAVLTASAATSQSSLPVDMQGTWGWDEEACGDRVSDGRVAVTSRTVEFYASAYDLDDPRPVAGGAWESRAKVFEEGEEQSGEASITLRLQPPDGLEIRTGDEEPFVYVRCADDLPVR